MIPDRSVNGAVFNLVAFDGGWEFDKRFLRVRFVSRNYSSLYVQTTRSNFSKNTGRLKYLISQIAKRSELIFFSGGTLTTAISFFSFRWNYNFWTLLLWEHLFNHKNIFFQGDVKVISPFWNRLQLTLFQLIRVMFVLLVLKTFLDWSFYQEIEPLNQMKFFILFLRLFK